MTNQQRSERVYRALLAYYGATADSMETCVKELLRDMTHLCPEYGIELPMIGRIIERQA